MRVRHRMLVVAGGIVLLAGATGVPLALAAPNGGSGGTIANPVAAERSVPGDPNVTRSCARVTKTRTFACGALRRTDAIHPYALSADAVPAGYGPSDLASAYNLPDSGGSGETVAIVDAYNDPSAESDLAAYRSRYNLPACTTANGCFRKVNQRGATSPLPGNNGDWAGEISLDLDMVSAICPGCHILLVEADSAAGDDLYAAVDYAAAHAGYVSNSWGGSEYQGETTDDVYFNHPGVVITVSTGDDGAGAQFPATSPYVTAVGGTSLDQAGNARGWTESAWNGAGSGCSARESQPVWQDVPTGCGNRAEADVSAVADPETGVAVYQSYPADSSNPSNWWIYGGTSAAAPIIASVYALAGAAGHGDYPVAYPYGHRADLFDVLTGSNGSCGTPICTAGTGWDGPTGLGTPNGTAAFAGAGDNGGGGTGDCAGNLLGNAGFETGSAVPWRTTPGVVNGTLAGEVPHTGSWYAWLDGYGTTHTDTLSQSVSIPGDCTSATLSFFLRVDTQEGTTTHTYDTLTVRVGSSTLATYSNLNHGGYVARSVDLTSYIGQTVTITFTGSEDYSLATSFVIDDTSVHMS